MKHRAAYERVITDITTLDTSCRKRNLHKHTHVVQYVLARPGALADDVGVDQAAVVVHLDSA